MPAYLFILVLLAVVWFMLIRPQRRRQVQTQQMLDQIAVGDEIVTAGGLYGTITRLDDDEVRVEIAPGTEVRLARRAIAGRMTEDEEADEQEELEPATEPGEEREANLPS